MTEYQPLSPSHPVSLADDTTRAAFIFRTYLNLLGAICTFAIVEILLFESGVAYPIANAMLSVSWLWILGGFMIVGWLATNMSHRAHSAFSQYSALFLFIGAESIIFVPMLAMAQSYAPGVIESAATVTLVGFVGLTVVAFMVRKDFTFLGALLRWGFVVALVLIVASSLFGFQMGTFFTVVMIALAGGAVLHDTSKVLHHYSEDRHVAASLELFASVALLFWYVLRLFMSRR